MRRITTAIFHESTLPRPKCGARKTETMRTDYCQYFYECESCHALLKPEPGHCCVYCSYGMVPCPSIQKGSGRCADDA